MKLKYTRWVGSYALFSGRELIYRLAILRESSLLTTKCQTVYLPLLPPSLQVGKVTRVLHRWGRDTCALSGVQNRRKNYAEYELSETRVRGKYDETFSLISVK